MPVLFRKSRPRCGFVRIVAAGQLGSSFRGDERLVHQPERSTSSGVWKAGWVVSLRIHQRPLAEATFGWSKLTLSMQSFGAAETVAGKRSPPSGRRRDLVGLDVPSGTEDGTVERNLRVKRHHICERKVALGLPTGIGDLAHSFGGARGQTTDSSVQKPSGGCAGGRTGSAGVFGHQAVWTGSSRPLGVGRSFGCFFGSDCVVCKRLRLRSTRFQLKCGRK